MSAIVIRPSDTTPLLPKPSSPTASGTATPTRSRPLIETLSKPHFIILCLGIWSANFVFAFQATAIPTLAPEISSAFNHAELAAYLGSAFGLANTAGVPLYGVFMETLGRRMSMVTACLLFAVGTVGCALSGSMEMLIVARIVTGVSH